MSRVDNALLLRDTIQKIVDDKIGKTNPGASYATVTGFNPALGIITVRYPGDDVDIEIPAGSIYPSEVGQVVRIDGPPGARVVADVKGENLTEVKARTAQETADGKNTVNYGETPPEGTDHKDGDIWFDEGNSNMPHVWKDGSWVSIEDLRVSAIAEAQDELRQDLDTVVENGVGTKSFYKPTEPTAAESKEGDLWFDTSAGGNNELHTYVNGSWVSAADARIAAIQQAQTELASDLEDVVANGIGTRTHYTPTQPAVADSKEGDLWFDTSTAGKNALHVFTGGAWVSAADARLAELKDAQAEMTGDITAAQQKADEAFQNAADADSKAATAQAKADLANDRAQAILRASNSIVPNGDFENNSPNIWPNTTHQSGISVVEVDHARSGTHVMRMDSTSGNRYPLTDWRSSGEGRIYYAEVWVYHNDTDMTQRGRVSFYANSEFKDGSTTGYYGQDLDGRYVYVYQDEMTPGVWNKVSAYITAPENTVNIRVAPHVLRNETPFDLDDFKVIDVTESIAALREANQAKADADTAKTAADAAQATATSAQSAADAAGDAASQAQSKANEAKTAADAAQSTATNAQTAAGTAQSTADAAKSDAAAAAGIANGKGKVLVQSTAPGAADRNAQTLWIDTTGGANTPKRWTTGTTWVAVTDKAATDAASAAVAAQSTADQAKANAATAQTKADQAKAAADAAQAAANNAQSTATEALTSANSKNTVTRSTSNPTTPYTGRVDDIWWKMSTLSSGGRVIAQYRWNGTAWLTETIDNAVIANLDAAKITTGYLDAARIKANTLNADTVLINGSLGSIILRDGAITTPKIAVGAITAESGVVASLDAGKITVGTLDAARIATNSITADKVLIGSDRNLLPNGDLSTGDSSGWSSRFTYQSTDTPPASAGAVDITGTASTRINNGEKYAVQPGEIVVFEAWIKADKPNSALVMEMRDQSGEHVRRSGYDWSRTDGATTSVSYPLYCVVPTAWTKVSSQIVIPPGVTSIYRASFIPNHSSGTDRTATFSLSGMKLYKQVGSTLIEPGAITTEKIAVGAITAESGLIASLDAGKITVGTLDVARIAAGSITADKVLIEGPLNLIPGTVPGTNRGFSEFQWDSTEKSLKVEGTKTLYADGDLALPPGQYIVEADVKTSAVSRFYIGVYGRTASYSYRYGISNQTSTTSWKSYSDTLNILEGEGGTASLRMLFDYQGSGTVTTWIRNITLRRRVGSTLIEPGAITTEKIATGAITAESGVIGSLDASKITVGKLSGARLEADAINGMQIIGATIATSTGFPRVQLDSAGLAVYKSSSVRSFFADASSGDLSIVGDFATATAGNERVFLSNTLWNSIQIVDDTGTVIGTTAGSGIRVGPGDQGTLDLYHGGRLAPSGSYVDVGIMKGPRSAAQPNGASVSVNKTTLPDGSEFNWAALTATNRSGRVVGRVGTSASGPHTFIESDGKIQMSASKGGFSIETDIGSIRTDSKYPRIEFEAPKMMFLAPEPAEPTNPSLSYLEFLFDSHLKHSGTYISSSTQRNGTPRPITIGGWPGTNYVKVDSDIVTLGAQGRVVIDNYFSPVAEFNYGQGNASWNVSFKKAGTDWGYVGSTGAMGADDFGIQSGSGKRLFLSAAGSSTNITIEPSGSINLNVPTSASGSPRLKSTAVWNATSSSGSTVRVNSSGTLFNDGSSERYKQDIEDAPKLTSILDVRPRTWRERWAVKASEDLAEYRKEVTGPVPIELGDAPEEAPWYYGAIAEEIHDLGLTEFVQYDAFGRPDGLYYDRMSVALIPFIKELLTRVDALESMLDTPTETAPVE